MHEGLKRRGRWTGLAQGPLIASLPQRAVCDRSSFLSGGLHMRVHLTEKLVKAEQADPARKRFVFDDECIGFALSVSPAGSKRFVLDYYHAGRQRRMTIGAWPAWSVTAGRVEAQRVKRDVDRGIDPLAVRDEVRTAPTVGDLAEEFIKHHLPRLAPRNASDQESMLRKLVLPEWSGRKVADISPLDVEALLDKVAAGRARPAKAQPKSKRRRPLAPPRPTPVRANRCGEMLRKMFNLAIKWKMRADNPALDFHRRDEVERETFLSLPQIEALADYLGRVEDQRAAGIVRLCMLTGCRLGEARCARFDQFNLDLGIWTKQAAQTKQRKVHRLPISADTAALVRLRREAVPADCPWLFPGDVEGQPVTEIRRFWRHLQEAIDLEGVRLHDLRHTFASLLVSGGASLEIIGKLLGHTQAKTTQRYAHLMDSPLRAGVDAVGGLLRPRLRLVED